MPVIGSVDSTAKRIHLAIGVRAYHPVDDLYREMRALRRTDETLRPYDVPLIASGNVPKGGGKSTPRLVTFRQGWKVVPEDVSHTLNVTGEQITDDGQSGPAAIDFAPLSSTSKVVVNYEPPSAEIIQVGSGVTTQDKTDIAELSRQAIGRNGLRRSAALPYLHVVMMDAAAPSVPKTGLTVTGQRVVNDGALVALTNPVSEIGGGLYRVDGGLTADEMDGEMVSLLFLASGAVPRPLTLVTVEA